MTAYHVGQHRLEIEDFGPIAKADVELRPLTVLAGPSNTGKSYVAKLVYALQGYFAGRLLTEGQIRVNTDSFETARTIPDLQGLVEWLEKHLRSAAKEGGDSSIPEGLAVLSRVAVRNVVVESAVLPEILRVFDARAVRELVRNPDSCASFTLSHLATGTHSGVAPFRYAFAASTSQLTCDLDVPEDAPIRFDRTGNHWPRAFERGFFESPSESSSGRPAVSFMRLEHVLAELSQPSTVGALSRPAWYLPAGRAGIVEAQGAVLGSSIDRLTRGRERHQGSLSGVLVDFLKNTVVDLRSNPSLWPGGEVLAQHVEQTIIGGTVRVDEFLGAASAVAYRPANWKEDLPLTRASSMVTEIIPLVLCLRHYVTPGSTIIIEEPEAHMHPAMQVRMASALAAIVEAGIRVIITTHSEWILSALANIVRMAGMSKSKREDIVGGDVTLPASHVGAWLFEPDESGGTVTRELCLDSDDGMYDAGYPAVAKALYDDWAAIISRLQED